MHLLIIMAFAVILWRAEESGRWTMTAPDKPLVTCLAVAGLPLLTILAGWTIGRVGIFRLKRNGDAQDVHHFLQRSTLVLRAAQLAGFGAIVFLTHWPLWLEFGNIHPVLQFVGDLIVVTPYLLSLVLVWVVTFPLENELRLCEAGDGESVAWGLSRFLDFHIRHYVVVIVVPMAFILLASGVANGYEKELSEAFGTKVAPNVLVAFVAGLVYLLFPLLLRHIWRMEPLPAGELRNQLESLCKTIDLRCRDILIWKSDGVMINAAVMGLLPSVRYVLLSDALLSTMSASQVEGVFGHEAGHIRKRHIHQFLLFAFLGWLMTAVMVESLSRIALGLDFVTDAAVSGIQVVGLLATILFWAVGFGMLSRRFERQADLYGARCVTVHAENCGRACSVHREDNDKATPADGHEHIVMGTNDDARCAERVTGDRVCAGGASVFASALDRVSRLNGIPQDEWHWRYDSIGDRIHER